MDQVDIPAARALADAATEGPWRALPETAPGLTGVHASGGSGIKIYHATLADDAHPDTHRRQRADAAFIAATRALIPALCDEVERLRERLDCAVRFDVGDATITAERGGYVVASGGYVLARRGWVWAVHVLVPVDDPWPTLDDAWAALDAARRTP